MQDDLNSRIAKARSAHDKRTGKDQPDRGASAVGAALQFSMSFVAAVGIGALIGHTIDNFAHTGPWGLLIFMMFGMAAGFLSIIRAAQKMSLPPVDTPPEKSDTPDTTTTTDTTTTGTKTTDTQP